MLFPAVFYQCAIVSNPLRHKLCLGLELQAGARFRNQKIVDILNHAFEALPWYPSLTKQDIDDVVKGKHNTNLTVFYSVF